MRINPRLSLELGPKGLFLSAEVRRADRWTLCAGAEPISYDFLELLNPGFDTETDGWGNETPGNPYSYWPADVLTLGAFNFHETHALPSSSASDFLFGEQISHFELHSTGFITPVILDATAAPASQLELALADSRQFGLPSLSVASKRCLDLNSSSQQSIDENQFTQALFQCTSQTQTTVATTIAPQPSLPISQGQSHSAGPSFRNCKAKISLEQIQPDGSVQDISESCDEDLDQIASLVVPCSSASSSAASPSIPIQCTWPSCDKTFPTRSDYK